MRSLAADCLLVLALASACSGEAEEGTSQPRAGLHRALHLPSVAAGAPCPVTDGGRPNPDVAIALGPGPAYPVLGYEGNRAPPDPKAVVPLYREERRGGAYWHKTLWAVDPKYDGPVLIRARGLDPAQLVQFAEPSAAPGGSAELVGELEFRREQTNSWRYGPSMTILPGPGCYAFQVDGTTFSEVIVFEAALVTT
jgi:hypothetical protein